MMEHRRLNVGTVFENGPPSHTSVEIDGEELAKLRTSPVREVQTGSWAMVTQDRTLFHCAGDRPFVVYTLEEYLDEPARRVARLERYGSWGELMEDHPDLAQRVGPSKRAEGTVGAPVPREPGVAIPL